MKQKVTQQKTGHDSLAGNHESSGAISHTASEQSIQFSTQKKEPDATAPASQQIPSLLAYTNREPVQQKSHTAPETGINFTIQKKENKTGLPDNLKSGIENLSGHAMDDVKVHYNSSQPAQLNAHAYAQGNQIHIAPGQEKHLPHEAWHVVQQKQGRVKPTKQLKSSVAINDDTGLEKEADVMGARAIRQFTSIHKNGPKQYHSLQFKTIARSSVQRIKIYENGHDGDESHLLLDTAVSVPEADTIRNWSEEKLNYVSLKLSQKDAPDSNERQLAMRLRSEKARRERVANNRKNEVGFAVGDHIRTTHARTPGVWKHWTEPESDPHDFIDKHPALTPKDASGGNKIHHMQYTSEDGQGEELIRNMVVIASHEKFKLQVSGTRADLRLLKEKLGDDHWAFITPVEVFNSPSEWAEDSGEYLKQKHTGVPLAADSRDLQTPIKEERLRRGYDPKEKWGSRSVTMPVRNPASDVGTGVHEGRKQREKVAEAKATGRGDKLVSFKSYLEGGNVLSGTDLKGKPFALVGKDALAATRHLLDSGLTDEQIHKIVAGDLGLPPDCVVFVEQPGQFHLDMGIVILGQGQVILNDSKQVFELMMKWLDQDRDLVLRDLDLINAGLKIGTSPISREEASSTFELVKEKLTAALKERFGFEEMAAADLEKAGIKVIRLPASFPQTPFTPAMNFLNGESGVGPDGRSFFITNGGDARAEDAVSTAYFDALHSSQLARIYFTDASKSEDSLGKGGGIGCRDKTECDT